MTIEHFYWFIDREVVDPVLEMSWKTFLRRYPWDHEELDYLLNFAVDGEPDPAEISRILENRTLRWTIKRSSPAYWFLNEIVHHVPALRLRCPEVWIPNDFDLAILEAVAVDGYLRGRISDRTLWTVYNLHHGLFGKPDPKRWLDLTRSEFKRVKAALKCGAVEKPIFPWQSDDCLTDGYRCLGIKNTRLFIDFLCTAWQEHWSIMRLNEAVRKEVADVFMPCICDYPLAPKLIACAKIVPLARPCLVRYFG
jgi:hypothetical protein